MFKITHITYVSNNIGVLYQWRYVSKRVVFLVQALNYSVVTFYGCVYEYSTIVINVCINHGMALLVCYKPVIQWKTAYSQQYVHGHTHTHPVIMRHGFVHPKCYVIDTVSGVEVILLKGKSIVVG